MSQISELQSISFSDPNMLDWLDQQTPELLDELPFGVVRMTREGVAVAYNKTEAELVGISPEYVLGKYYFAQVAVCANNMLVAAKYALPEIDEEMEYMLTYVCEPVKVRIRLLKSLRSNYQYFLVNNRFGTQ